MRLQKKFHVDRNRETAVQVMSQDDTLTGLFPDTETEIVERKGNRKTAVSRYRALGQEGEATFHFTFEDGGDVRFEKVCDGRVWKKLTGCVEMEGRGDGTRVLIEMEGSTKGFVPEFTIKGTMQEQIEQMAEALRDRIETS